MDDLAINADNLDETFNELQEIMKRRILRAAEEFKAEVQNRLPKRIGKVYGDRLNRIPISEGVKIVERREGMEQVVIIPWPWPYEEFGTTHQGSNPIGRQTLLEMAGRITAILSGAEDNG